MRIILSILLLSALSFTCLANETSHPQKAEIEKQVAEFAASQGANKHSMLDYFMNRINGVDKVINVPVDFNVALQIADCSDKAAHPDDPGKFGEGIEFSKIDGESAVASCLQAYRNGGAKVGLVLASLSRAYNKLENYKSSLEATRAALLLKYPFADVLMANHYGFGDGVEKSVEEQFRWYLSAAKRGITSAMRVTSNNYRIGEGTKTDLHEAYLWAKKALENNDNKAFYQLGAVLEVKATESLQRQKLLRLAKEAYEIVSENGVTVDANLKSVNKKLLPNVFSPHAINFRTPSGKEINGTFVSHEKDSNWYLLRKNRTDKDGNAFAYARTSHDSTTLKVWYQHAVSPGYSGWYIEFSRVGLNDIREISVTATIAGKPQTINLDLSGSKEIGDFLDGRMMARINYRDVLLLARAENVKILHHVLKKVLNYTMALNNEDLQDVHRKQSAKTVLNELIIAARNLDENCCNEPVIDPLSEYYGEIYDQCKSKSPDWWLSEKWIRQNCHTILKNAESSSDAIIDPFGSGINRLLKEAKEVFKE